MFYKNVRKYDSCLEAALYPDNVPTSVYKGLIESVNNNLPTLHRYLKLRQRMLGLDDLHYYDMYPSLVEAVDISYTVEEAQNTIKQALAPLGADYVATLDEAFGNRWIDMYPNTGKRSGASIPMVGRIPPSMRDGFIWPDIAAIGLFSVISCANTALYWPGRPRTRWSIP